MITCNRSAFNCVLEMHASQNLTKLGGHKVLGMVRGKRIGVKLCSWGGQVSTLALILEGEMLLVNLL